MFIGLIRICILFQLLDRVGHYTVPRTFICIMDYQASLDPEPTHINTYNLWSIKCLILNICIN